MWCRRWAHWLCTSTFRDTRRACPREAAAELILDCLGSPLPDLDDLARRVEVAVCYATEMAPDLAEVAALCRLAPEEVASRHCASPHRVLMVGFVPGHPYIGGLDPALAVPRRTTPRPGVPAGSIAIANAQTVVYPFAIPGGWNIIRHRCACLTGREPPRCWARRQSGIVAISLARYEELERAAGGGRAP
jgi:KipI family sensor histidine kinase inhibitor